MIEYVAEAPNPYRTRADLAVGALMVIAYLDRIDALLDAAIAKCAEANRGA